MSAIWNSYSKSETARSPLSTRLCAVLLHIADQQARKWLHRDSRLVLKVLAGHLHPLFQGEERAFGAVFGHCDHNLVKDIQTALDQADVAEGQWVKCSG